MATQSVSPIDYCLTLTEINLTYSALRSFGRMKSMCWGPISILLAVPYQHRAGYSLGSCYLTKPLPFLFFFFSFFREERFAFGHHYFRPHETHHSPSRRFYHNELFRVPLYEIIPLEAVVGTCCVLDLYTYCKGKWFGLLKKWPPVCYSLIYNCPLCSCSLSLIKGNPRLAMKLQRAI